MSKYYEDIGEIVFDPSLISTLTVKAVEEARKDPDYLTTGIEWLDNHYVMLRPRKVNGIIADTSHGKTSLMHIISANCISQLRENEVAVYSTWEDSVEDFGISWLANVSRVPIASLYHGDMTEEQWSLMMGAAARRAATPLWAFGHTETGRRPRLTMTDIYRAMEYMHDKQGKRVRIIFLDYLQRISTTDIKSEGTREGFIEVMNRVKDLALAFNTCVVISSQIKREVAERRWKQPMIHDAQETSNFEQTCDGIISLWMPGKTETLDSVLRESHGVHEAVYVTENLMIMQTLKQKKGKAPIMSIVDFLPETNEIRKYNANRNLNGAKDYTV